MKRLDAHMKCQQALLDRLDKKKVHPSESYNSVICRLLFGQTEM